MQRRIRVGAVSYLNTKPLIFGFENGAMKGEIDLLIDYPSRIAEMLLKDEIDIGLVPVAVLPEMPEYFIIGDHGIASDGPVKSVCLFSEVPLNEIKTVLLDYQSRTSVALLKILLADHWHIQTAFKETSEDYVENIKDDVAGLIIGDRALTQRKKSKYIYDLGEAWKEYTSLPFVYAAWISNKKLDTTFIDSFNRANQMGLQNIDEVVKQNIFPAFDLGHYYNDCISFTIDEKKMEGLELFLEKMKLRDK